MNSKNKYGVVFLALMLLLPLCSGCGAVTEAVSVLDKAINALEQESANWRKVLEETRDQLTDAAQSTIRNEVSDVLSRSIAASGTEVKCVLDFIRTRARQDLIRIKTKLLNQPDPEKEPIFCNAVPLQVNADLVPSSLKSLELYGYDFDITLVQILLQNGNQYVDVSKYLDTPTHYHMTLNLARMDADGVKLSLSTVRFILKWNNQEIRSFGIAPPATPTPPPPPEQPGKFIVNLHSGRCIDVYGRPGVNSGAKLQLWDCEFDNPASDQIWKIRSDGFIQNKLGKCIDVMGTPGTENGTKLQIWDCEVGNPASDQIWKITSDGFIQNKYGRCIDVLGTPGVGNGTDLQIYDCEFGNSATDQRWTRK